VGRALKTARGKWSGKSERPKGTLGYIADRLVSHCRVMSIGEWLETKGQKRAQPGDDSRDIGGIQRLALMADYAEGHRLFVLSWGGERECLVYAPVATGPSREQIAAVFLAQEIQLDARRIGLNLSAHGLGVVS
jgi:hypothetical protein